MPNWPLWQQFSDVFVSVDGRVIDRSLPQQHSTSEGQSYGMLFALVANDKQTFDRLWRWSVNNLAHGNIAEELPAWRWGRSSKGEWGVLDANPASDANLWFVYALLEAARLWREPRYQEDALYLLEQVRQKEIVTLPGFGTMLLPAPTGFTHDPGDNQPERLWRLNPSYLVVPQLRRIALADPNGPWLALAHNTVRMLQQVAPRGLVPDWAAYQASSQNDGTFIDDPEHGAQGSYDAIRSYLWGGVTSRGDPLWAVQLASLSGMATVIDGRGGIPERINTRTGNGTDTAPIGFSAALLPYFAAMGRFDFLRTEAERVRAAFLGRANTPPPVYYDYVLALFGLGWADGRYRFSYDGQLQVGWELKCPDSDPH